MRVHITVSYTVSIEYLSISLYCNYNNIVIYERESKKRNVIAYNYRMFSFEKL